MAARRGIVVAALLVASCGRLHFTDQPDAASTWVAGWRARKLVTIDHAQVAGDLAAFPVLLDAVAPDLAPAFADGHDIAFFAGADALAYEREAFDNGHVIAWIRVPALSAEVDTSLYLYFDNATAADQQQASAVWSEHFTGVYHFGDGTTLDSRDATGVNDGTPNTAIAAPGTIVRGGVAFAGTTTFWAPTTGMDTSAGGLNTVSFWLDYTGPIGNGPVAFVVGSNVYDLWFQANACAGFNTQASEVLGTTATPLTGHWVHVAAVFYNGVPDPAFNAIYIDGAAQPLTKCYQGGTAVARAVGGTIELGGNPGYQITGTMDEARVANVARSAAWIATEHQNAASPATFATLGPTEIAP